MVNKDKLREYAKKLMFDLEETEYETLAKEFDIMLKQMEFIGNIDNISDIEPMIFPFELDDVSLREDIVENRISFEDMKINVNKYEDNRVKVPKVVE